MLFRRRKPADSWDRIRTWLWPRRSVWRSTQYFVKRVLRITATPHAVAAGVAAGVLASFTPFLGFHFLIAAAVAIVLRGNVVASALGTMVGNPITFPFIFAGTLGLGRFLLYGRHPESLAPIDISSTLRHLDFAHIWQPLLWPMTLGGLVIGSLAGLTVYVLTRWGAYMFREERRRRLAERAKRRAEASLAAQASTA
ncbi:MAG: DUF2062 domain-containing protein [Rhizobiaceae bacterium]|jgi:hypothetical protein|nr:DUF2062 domain-containing protein [Rhizobiaceae bacterium]MBO6725670.1 DUF2062 domain-containing protein [Rhizobiaceae bacterium]